MWPEGEIPDWYLDPEIKGIKVEFEFPEGTPEEEIRRVIKEYYEKADELHRAYGGSGLKVCSNGVDAIVPLENPQPVCV